MLARVKLSDLVNVVISPKQKEIETKRFEMINRIVTQHQAYDSLQQILTEKLTAYKLCTINSKETCFSIFLTDYCCLHNKEFRKYLCNKDYIDHLQYIMKNNKGILGDKVREFVYRASQCEDMECYKAIEKELEERNENRKCDYSSDEMYYVIALKESRLMKFKNVISLVRRNSHSYDALE